MRTHAMVETFGAPKSTPWGQVQSAERIADGIVSVSTAGHGGIHLDRSRMADMRKRCPALAKIGDGPWFEEDCACNAVRIAFAGDFDAWIASRGWGTASDWSLESAQRSIRHIWPDVAHAAGFGYSPQDYAAMGHAIGSGAEVRAACPESSFCARTYAGHVVGLDSRESARVVDFSVGGTTLGYWHAGRWHDCRNLGYWASPDKGEVSLGCAYRACKAAAEANADRWDAYLGETVTA